MNTNYYEVTEISGTEVSQEQVERMCQRYYWAKNYCLDKDVLEVACGAGQGLGYLEKFSKSIEGGDYSDEILKTPIPNDDPLNWINEKKYNQFKKFKEEEATEYLDFHLNEEAKLMIPETKFGCIVSGGIDSSLQAAIISKYKTASKLSYKMRKEILWLNFMQWVIILHKVFKVL